MKHLFQALFFQYDKLDQLENELFSCGGARLYADAFLSAEARKTAARCALEGNAAELKNFLKAK